MKTKNLYRRAGVMMPRAVAVAVAIALAQTAVQAADAPEAESGDLKVTWTNTFKYGVASRLKGQDPALITPFPNTNVANLDDGNRNFGKGLISNRIELLSELDAVHRDGFGARLSGAAWYDSVYNGKTDNPGFIGGAVPNHFPYSDFPNKTRDLNGRKAEIRDAFVFGKTEVGGGMPLTVRLGQHALVWGESLFFANNAIAGGQSAYDISKLLADPTAQAKEFVLPVPQISAQLQVSSDFSLAAYYQFRHRGNRTPSVGSYFSISDIVGDGAEQMWIGPGVSVPRDPDMKPRNSGQFGVQAKLRLGEADLGLYAIRFHDKDPQQITRLGLVNVGAPQPVVMPTSYYLGWHEATTAVGASISQSFGNVNLAAEGSIRHNQSLASSGHATDVAALGAPASNVSDNPAYAVGKTAHLNISAIWSLQPSPLWREALFIGEVAWNRLLKCTKSCAALDPNATKDSVSFRIVFEPTYRQVQPGLDISVPIGLGYTPKGSRSVLGPFGFPAEDGGDFTIGLSGVYQQTWRFNLAYTNFFGKAQPLLDPTRSFSYQQNRADRDFVSFTVRRSF
jgi:opacity protein-like surface antigen